LAAVRESVGGDSDVLYARGLPDDLSNSTAGFEEAVAAAKKADAVVMVLGENASLSGEAHSRASLDLPGAQVALLEAVAAAKKPVVLVIEAGRPLTIGPQVEKVDAVLYSFHAGTMAGPAIADLLWGVESPSGKLPVTFPKQVGQIPLYYNHDNTGRPPRKFNFATDARLEYWPAPELGNTSTYIDVGPYPLYPFGFGLSYTTFDYDRVEFSAKESRPGKPIVIRASIANTGEVPADEVTQLYVHQRSGRLARPVRELKGFRRVRLEPGERKEVEFSLTTDDLAYFDNDGVRAVDEAEVQVFVGGDSLAPEAGVIQVFK
jgi:beta-glucosidase